MPDAFSLAHGILTNELYHGFSMYVSCGQTEVFRFLSFCFCFFFCQEKRIIFTTKSAVWHVLAHFCSTVRTWICLSNALAGMLPGWWCFSSIINRLNSSWFTLLMYKICTPVMFSFCIIDWTAVHFWKTDFCLVVCYNSHSLQWLAKGSMRLDCPGISLH